MIVFINGQFVPEEQAVVSVFDRGFLYGDGLFETLRYKGIPFRWAEHMRRLEQGAQLLNICIPYPAEQLRDLAGQLVQRNLMPDAMLRLTLSRGVGVRGYSPKGADRPTLVMGLHPAPGAEGEALPKWRVKTASFRLPADEPLARFKTCNKLPQILARAEAEAAAADEALLLNTRGEVVEAASGNLFWIKDNKICTPPLASGILAGVTRTVVLELCSEIGLPTRESSITPEELLRVEGIFLSLSSWGVIEVISVDNHAVAQSAVVKKVQAAYAHLTRTAIA